MSDATTLIADDTPSLVQALISTADRIGVRGAEFFTSLSDAWKAASESRYLRFIVDFVFEGEVRTGIDFLEEVRERQPEAELVLLTGKYISPQNRDRIEKIGASYIKKSQLDPDMLALMLSPAPLPGEGLAGGPEIDIAELRLQYEALARQFEEARMLNDLLVEDILSELANVRSQAAPAVMIAGRLLSAADLSREIKSRTEVGQELIRLHHELNRQLRRKR